MVKNCFPMVRPQMFFQHYQDRGTEKPRKSWFAITRESTKRCGKRRMNRLRDQPRVIVVSCRKLLAMRIFSTSPFACSTRSVG